MGKDFWKLLAWVLGFTALFSLILWSVALLTNAKVIDSARSIHAVGILVAICVGGVFAYQEVCRYSFFQNVSAINGMFEHAPQVKGA